MKLIFATGNENKMREIRQIFGGFGFEIQSMKEAGIDIDIVEDGTSFQENALIKARAVHEASGALVLADDSGLEIDALGKEPGIYSARYLGEDTSYDVKNANLIDRVKDVPEDRRGARFICAVAAVLPDGRSLVQTGVMEGRVAYAPAGENGFGYDPIFFLPQYGKTSAEISPEQKNAISHRGQALRMMKMALEAML
jgi:XTP/dITP diphosphohydrolase